MQRQKEIIPHSVDKQVLLKGKVITPPSCEITYPIRGKKFTCPGARDKLNFRQDKHIFSPNVRRTSKKINASIFFLDKDKLFGNRTSQKFGAPARGTSENF